MLTTIHEFRYRVGELTPSFEDTREAEGDPHNEVVLRTTDNFCPNVVTSFANYLAGCGYHPECIVDAFREQIQSSELIDEDSDLIELQEAIATERNEVLESNREALKDEIVLEVLDQLRAEDNTGRDRSNR